MDGQRGQTSSMRKERISKGISCDINWTIKANKCVKLFMDTLKHVLLSLTVFRCCQRIDCISLFIFLAHCSLENNNNIEHKNQWFLIADVTVPRTPWKNDADREIWGIFLNSNIKILNYSNFPCKPTHLTLLNSMI